LLQLELLAKQVRNKLATSWQQVGNFYGEATSGKRVWWIIAMAQ